MTPNCDTLRKATRMIIDLDHEAALPLSAAAKLLPPVRGTKPPHRLTLTKWAKAGLPSVAGNRVVLETFLLGGTRVTTKEALRRFFDRLNDGEAEPVAATAKNKSKPAKRPAGDSTT
jgi:hypothetical protein